MLRLTLLAALALTVLAPAAEAAGPNLLRNASFEQSLLRAWSVGQGGTQSAPGVAREGQGYASVGDSIAQDVTVSVPASRSHSFSLWVRSASGRPVAGAITVTGLSGPVEGTSTDFTAGADWQLVTATLSPTHAHTALRAQVDVRTAGESLLVDGAQLLDARLRNASFEDASGWTADGATLQLAGSPRDGVRSGVVTAAERGGSVQQDRPFAFAAGEHYTFSAWVRSASGAPVEGRLGLWAGQIETEGGFSTFTAGAEWQLVSVTIRPTNPSNTALRAQVQVLTPGLGLAVDAAQLTPVGLGNASFEQPAFRGWDLFPRGPLTVAQSEGGGARDGDRFATVRADAAGRSFAQDVPVATDAGGSQAFSVWLRSPDSAGVTGSLVLTGNGGEAGATAFRVGTSWTLISAPLDAERAHSGLRAEVVLDTPGRDLQVDAASLAAGNARAGGTPRLPEPPVVTPEPTPTPTPVTPAAKPDDDLSIVTPLVRSAISYKWKATRRYTTVTRLIVRDVPANGWVELRCTGKGKGCPTTRPVIRRRIATTSFKTLFGDRRLKPGARIEVRVLAPRMIGKVARFEIRAGKLPKATFGCVEVKC